MVPLPPLQPQTIAQELFWVSPGWYSGKDGQLGHCENGE